MINIVYGTRTTKVVPSYCSKSGNFAKQRAPLMICFNLSTFLSVTNSEICWVRLLTLEDKTNKNDYQSLKN